MTRAPLDLLDGGLVTHAAEMGAHLQTRLRTVMERRPLIGDLRGLGLMTAVDFVTDRETRRPDPAVRNTVIEQAFHRGV
ncbi:MAG: aminotransferase class III-fold pyridoxal phosphate-dependent enzyme, partial [Acidobacteria bacterium]